MQIHNELDTKFQIVQDCTIAQLINPEQIKRKRKKVYYAVICDKNFQDTNLWAHMPTRKHKWTVTYSKKNKPRIPVRNQEDDKNCQYKCVKGLRYTDSKHWLIRENSPF